MNATELKNLPKQTPFFENGKIINTRIGEMMVIDNEWSHELMGNEWIPVIRLAFVNKDGSKNKHRNHRTFIQVDLKPLNL